MSASHDSSNTSVPSTPLAPISNLGSNDQGWLQELAMLGYKPNAGTWQAAPPPGQVTTPAPGQQPMTAQNLYGVIMSGSNRNSLPDPNAPQYYTGPNN